MPKRTVRVKLTPPRLNPNNVDTFELERPSKFTLKVNSHFRDGSFLGLEPEHSQTVRNHSPDGFQTGYSGSGPSQLALAMLLEMGMPESVAVAHYTKVRERFIVPISMEAPDAIIDANEIESFLREITGFD